MIAQAAQAQTQVQSQQTLAFAYSARVVRLVERIKSNSDRLQENVDSFLDRSRLDGSNREDNINDRFKKFRDAADDLNSRIDDRDPPEGKFRELFSRWQDVENVLQRSPGVARNFQRDLDTMRSDLNQLRDMMGTKWRRR
jgi:uncharacterized coiled-coil DUF342 family protein